MIWPLKFPVFNLAGDGLDICSKVKYLGHIITDKLTDDDDIYRQCRSLYAQANTQVRRFGMVSNDVKITLFQTFCTFLYAVHLWTHY